MDAITHRTRAYLTRTLDSAVAGLPEVSQRIIMALAVRDPADEVELSVAEVCKVAGGDYTHTFKTALVAVEKLAETRYTISYDPAQKFAEGGVLISHYKIDKGTIKLQVPKHTQYAISNMRAKFTILHLSMVKSIGGAKSIGLYIMLARWDSSGEVTYDLATISKELQCPWASKKPTEFHSRTVIKLINELNRVGVGIKVEKTGRGKKTKWTFMWPRKAFQRVADSLSPPDLGIPYDADAELRVRAEAHLATAGCFDPHMPRRLMIMPAQEALDMVTETIVQGFSKGALRNELVARLDRWETRQASETVRKQREAAAAEKAVIDIEAVVDQEAAAAAWIATAADDDLAAAALELEDYNWNMLLPKFPKPETLDEMTASLPVLRKRAKANPTLAVFLACKAGVVAE